jgi:DNA-binding transcriptional MerR regulator
MKARKQHSMTLNTLQVSMAAQVTLRQLQHWDELKVVQPKHAGHRRSYDAVAFFKALLVARMRSKKLSLERIRKSLATLPIEKLMETPEACLLVSGRSMHILRDEAVAMRADLENGPVCVICIAPLIEIVNREIRKRRAH